MEALKQKLQQKLAYLWKVLGIVQNNLVTTQGQQIFTTAKSLIGTDVSPNDLAPDELGCAETVSTLLNRAGFPMPIILSTSELWRFFSQSDVWVEVMSPLPGDVIISPTGQGGKNGITHGHTGIVGEGGRIMSNDSATGKFVSNYSIASWTVRYKIKGGYNTYYFRRI